MVLKGFVNRENEIFDILAKLKRNGINFILVGGYAVSAFKHRFSVDVDIVVKEDHLRDIIQVLQKNDFKEYKSKDLKNLYGGRFLSFIKKGELPITVDLLINSISSSQTEALWSFDLLKENSVEEEIVGIEKSIKAFIPIKELLIALKIHSGRLTDIRDVVAICDNTNLNRIVEFSLRGDKTKLREALSKFEKIIKSKTFSDAFKGIFSLEKLSVNNIRFSEKIIYELKRAI